MREIVTTKSVMKLSNPKSLIIGIMACDPNGVIGRNNQIPWSFKNDIEFFTKITNQHVIIMGRKTFQSIPSSILAGRFNIVFSRTVEYVKNNNITENTIFVKSLEEFLSLQNLPQNKKYYMIGGGEIARLFLEANLIDMFLLTRLKKCYSGDRFFPLELLQNYSTTILQYDQSFIIYQYTK